MNCLLKTVHYYKQDREGSNQRVILWLEEERGKNINLHHDWEYIFYLKELFGMLKYCYYRDFSLSLSLKKKEVGIVWGMLLYRRNLQKLPKKLSGLLLLIFSIP